MKVNGKDCVYPCFVGFNSTYIVIVKVNLELKKQQVDFISALDITHIKIKKGFLSKIFNITIECKENTHFVLGIPYKLKYIPTQTQGVERFLKLYHNQ